MTAAPQERLVRLVESATDDLVRLAARVLGNAADAEDTVQSAWARALEALRGGSFRDEAQLKTWLYRIVLNEALNRRRGAQRRSARELAAAPATHDDGTASEVRVALRKVAALLDELPPEQARALVLKEFHGMTAREVGHVLDCSEGAVEQRVLRAKAALSRRVGA